MEKESKKIPADMQALMRDIIHESLKDWFKEKWVRINTSGNITGPCGTMKKGKTKTRCLPKAKAQSLTKAQRKATVAKKVKGGKKGKQFVKNTKAAKVKKETANPQDGKAAPYGSGYKVVNEIVREAVIEYLLEKNIPTDPSKWSYYKSQAKKKFDVYPSAYANGWAAKQYKAAGGGWKKAPKKKKKKKANEIIDPFTLAVFVSGLVKGLTAAKVWTGIGVVAKLVSSALAIKTITVESDRFLKKALEAKIIKAENADKIALYLENPYDLEPDLKSKKISINFVEEFIDFLKFSIERLKEEKNLPADQIYKLVKFETVLEDIENILIKFREEEEKTQKSLPQAAEVTNEGISAFAGYTAIKFAVDYFKEKKKLDKEITEKVMLYFEDEGEEERERTRIQTYGRSAQRTKSREDRKEYITRLKNYHYLIVQAEEALKKYSEEVEKGTLSDKEKELLVKSQNEMQTKLDSYNEFYNSEVKWYETTFKRKFK